MPRRSQEERSRTTKAALVETGRRLFGDRGYANVSAEEIVTSAGVTRGALHHHFGDKRGLFIAVLEEVEMENAAEIGAVEEQFDDPWQAGLAAMARFLEISQRPAVVRIAMTDAPAVLGWQAWRELEERYGLLLITQMLQGGVDAGILKPAPIPALAKLLLSAIIEAGMIVAHAEDPDAVRAETQLALVHLLAGLVKPEGPPERE